MVAVLVSCSTQGNVGSDNSTVPSEEEKAVETIELQAFTSQEGSTGSVIGIAISEIMRKNHPSIRVAAQTSIGAEPLIEFDLNPDKRSSLIFISSQLTPSQARMGMTPFTSPIENPPLGLFTYGPGSSITLVTLNPDIKEIQDLTGKKVDIGPPGSNSYELYYPILEAAGIVDQIVLTPTEGLGSSSQALRDGLIDVGWTSLIPDAGPNSAINELLSQGKQVYFVNSEDQLFKQAAKNSGLTILPVKTQKGYFNELYKTEYDLPDRDINTNMYVPGFFASTDVPEEVIYELVKTLIKHKEELKNYHSAGAAMAKGMGQFLNKENMHPGAIRAYEETGMKIGIE